MIRPSALAKVLSQNIRRNFRSLALSSFGIVVGIAAFVFFWGLSQGVSRVVLHDIFPIDRVEVVAPNSTLTGLTATLDDTLVDKIRARPEVRDAYPKLGLKFPASGGGNLMGSSFNFEIAGFCDGIDPKLVENDNVSLFKDWEAEEGPGAACTIKGDSDDCPKDHYCSDVDNKCHHRVPVLVSHKIIELYNGWFAPSHNMPRIGALQEAVLKDTMKSMRFKMKLGKSMFGGEDKLNAPVETIEGQLVGISDKAMPTGMTVPIGYLRRWNTAYKGPDAAKSYSSIVVRLKDRAYLTTFVPWLKKNGLEQADSMAENIALIIKIVTALFVLIAFTICFISAVNISHTFFMLVSERRKEIGLLRSIGATRVDVWKILLCEAGAVGLVAGSIGVLVAMALAKTVDFISAKHLPDFAFKPTTYFQFSPGIIALALGFAILFCVVGAALPARQAARIHPAQALLG